MWWPQTFQCLKDQHIFAKERNIGMEQMRVYFGEISANVAFS